MTVDHGGMTESYEERYTVRSVGGEYVCAEVTGLSDFPIYETMTFEEFVSALSPDDEM